MVWKLRYATYQLSIYKNKQYPWIAAVILIFQLVVELPNVGYFVAPAYLGNVTKVNSKQFRKGIKKIGLAGNFPSPIPYNG